MHTHVYVYTHTVTGQQKQAKKRGQCPIRIHGLHYPTVDRDALQHTATHCNTLQYTTTHGMVVLNSRLTVVVCRNM